MIMINMTPVYINSFVCASYEYYLQREAWVKKCDVCCYGLEFMEYDVTAVLYNAVGILFIV